MGIIVSNNAGNLYSTQNSSTIIFWEFTPSPIFKLVWQMGSSLPSVTAIKVKLPAYELISYYANYTDFELNVAMAFGSSPQIIKVEGLFDITTDLGVPQEQNSLIFYEKTLNFSFVNFNLLSLGTFFAQADYTLSAINPDTGLREFIIAQAMYFQIQVVNIATELLEYTWNLNLLNELYFSYYSGGTLPAVRDVTVYHNVPFTVAVSDPLLLFAVTASINYSLLEISFGPGISSLAVGSYNFQVTLNYGTGNSKTFDVQLEVFDTTDSFFVSTDTIIFEAYRNATLPPSQLVNTISPTVWSVNENLPIWLEASPIQGNGLTDIYLTVSNYNHLPTGSYFFLLEITNETETKTVEITLNLHDFVTHPFLPGKVSFTEALDYLEFNSEEVDPTFIEIDLQIKIFSFNLYEEINYSRQYKLPLYKGLGQFHIGTIVHQLLEEIKDLSEIVPLLEGNYSKVQYAPAEVTVLFNEKKYDSDDIVRSGSIDLIKFIKGHKPYVADSNLCLLTVKQQEFTRITPKSVIGIGFIHMSNPVIKIIKNGQLQEEYNVLVFSSSPSKIINSYYHFKNNFKPGDVIEIQISNDFEIRTQRFLVFPEGVSSTYFFFENDNGIIEAFEFTGRMKINNSYTHVTNKVFSNLFEIEQKVHSWNNQSVVVNTGQLLPTDHKIIDAIIRSENVWCSFENSSGSYFKVDSNTSKMTPSDTFKEDNSFDVEFNILENSDATIYPQ
ncbi:hypothetical protein LXD69_07370 [Flavobacterium sediminilitoris]|uniref:BACON domain-containing protein n=1 Tax=Flavobacterium sediminilitoris TaxID=2024526 RepID=A0ABY4HRU2_9FLAO|nr:MULTISPECIES: hypothetical protein [Flavobacterium]UOX35331.1 hypothetical protein LXD69_07370 [Flavobacterium sediminilitoris]